MAISVFYLTQQTWFTNTLNLQTSDHNDIILPGTIIKVWIRNICEKQAIQDQGCQLLSKFFDNMDYIFINNQHDTTQDQFSQEQATVRNRADSCLT